MTGFVGGCQCGTIRYTMSGPLPSAYACHCGECKQQSGSAFGLSIPVEWARMLVEGEVAISEGRAFSGKPKLLCFCPNCGNRMWHRGSPDSEWITLKAGTLDFAASIEPSGTLKGKEAIRPYWEKGLAMQPPIHFELIEVFVGANDIAIHYHSTTRGKRVVERIEFDEAGLGIRASGSYIDD